MISKDLMHQHCVETGCSQDDRLGMMDYRDGWQEREETVLSACHDKHTDTHTHIYISIEREVQIVF